MGSTIVEIEVGAGPAGELRYPSYQLDKWSFCGIGEFQSYSTYAVKSVAAAASAIGHPEWGMAGGPNNAGTYNSYPYQTGFFTNGNDNYNSAYGKFFLGWYSDSLLTHGEDIMIAARSVFGSTMKVSIKVCAYV
jgi:beta-amylase